MGNVVVVLFNLMLIAQSIETILKAIEHITSVFKGF